jgi:tRNA nucleotidyltransferase (CCA-adding enzyme)
MQDETFDSLAKIFALKGHSLYMVGGTSRDFLLGRKYADWDFTTDATPEEMKPFLPKADFSFAKYGSVKFFTNDQEVDITTLRQEGEYQDYRHPSFIKFVTDPSLDYLRRDFTINAIYITKDYKLLDYCGGVDDLKNKLIRFIGEPTKRVEEDPLRILRAYRFSKSLGFEIEPKTLKACQEGEPLLAKLNPRKVNEEKKKEER